MSAADGGFKMRIGQRFWERLFHIKKRKKPELLRGGAAFSGEQDNKRELFFAQEEAQAGDCTCRGRGIFVRSIDRGGGNGAGFATVVLTRY